MADYAIGDVQGCFLSLQKLLERIDFQAGRDRLFFAGDLVNRGPANLATLRWLSTHEKDVQVVLGNHDLYLLAIAYGVVPPKPADTLNDILQADDAAPLLDWLARQPLALDMAECLPRGLLVHAGVLPQWSREEVLHLAAEVSSVLANPAGRGAFLRAMFGNQPDHWSPTLIGHERWRVVINALTRLRVCRTDGTMEFTTKAHPEGAPEGFLPWYDIAARRTADTVVCFGHWSALGYFQRPNLVALDSGCVWGRQLTAVRLHDRVALQVSCFDAPASSDEA
jgi:bis(5'-nucleosyl)-tetraphosphatase (symmetrical)